MTLLTPEIRLPSPAPHSRSGIVPPVEKIVICKFFIPWGNWEFYVIEGEPYQPTDGPIDFEFYGLVDGFEKKFGYLLLSELEAIEGPGGLKIKRDPSVFKKPLEKLVSLDFLKR
jgi:hypothetical protein